MVHDLVAELHRRGVRLRLTEGRLDVLAPPSALTAELRARLREDRDELVALLARSEPGPRPASLPSRPEHRHEPFPLSDIQHAYWVGRSRAVELGGVATHFYVELERSGLHLDRLQTALRRVVERHDMLRAVVHENGTQQVLATCPAYEIEVTDLTGRSATDRQAGIERIREELAHRVAPADTWPLFAVRASLLDGTTRLHVSIDLLVADASSIALMFADWRRWYDDPDWAPEPVPVTYRDHVLAEEQARGGPRYAAARDYWTARLETLPPAPDLPLATSPSALDRPRFTRRRSRMSAGRWQALRAEAVRRGLTPSVVLATAYAEVLRAWSGRSHLTLNLSLFNRPPHPGLDQVVGDFTSVVLLEVDLSGDLGFADRARRVQRRLMQDLEHAEFSGVRVLRELARVGHRGPGAGMPVVFTSALTHAAGAESAGGSAFFGGSGFFGTFVYGISQTPQVWLDHQVAEEQGALYTNWDAVEALFPPGVLDAMFTAYGGLLDRLAAAPDAWEHGCRVSPPAAQLAVRDRPEPARTGGGGSDDDQTLIAPVLRRARQQPDAVAVVDGAGTWTYARLIAEAGRLAGALVHRGVGPERPVGIVLPPGRRQVAAVLGVLWAGGAYLPLDPDWPARRRHELLSRVGARLAVTSSGLRAGPGWPPGVTLLAADDPEVRAADPPSGPGPRPADLAYVIFTSGSTGTPKGVMIEHRAAANTLRDLNARFGVGPGDRVLSLSSLSFDLSVWDILGVLAAGGAVVLPHPGRARDPRHWTESVRRHGVTIWNSVPALMQGWLEEGDPGPDASVRLVLLSGDWISVTLPGAVRRRCPQARVVSLGGATEASIWSVVHPIGEVPPDWVRIPYGRALDGQSLHVLDDALEPCPDWTVGELHIGGRGLARGYWGDPDRTAERFLTHPRTGERLYATGDQARFLPGGDVEFLGRTDDQVKINGYRIELGEISAALRRQRGVRDAVTTVETNPVTGRRQLVAFVVPAAGTPGSAPSDPHGPGTGAPPSWFPDLVEAGGGLRRAAAGRNTAELDEYARVLAAFNEAAEAVIGRTLSRLGVLTPGRCLDAGRVVQGNRLLPHYRGLVGHWLELLAGRGRLRATAVPGEFRVAGDPGAERSEREAAQALSALPDHGFAAPLVDYLRGCADHQIELLRGEVEVLRFLLADGGDRVTGAMYADNPLSRVQNDLTARLVRAFVAGRPGDSPIRVLELGAGVGATTAPVLEQLPAGRTTYRFTDVSSFFTERARARFARHPFVQYAVLDIDRPLAGQGVAAGSVDLVIAANVLHNARDLDATLSELRGALAADALLLAVENTVDEPFHAISVGFYQDFGGYADGRRLPLLDPAGWRDRLRRAGFDGVGCLPDDGTPSLGQHLLLAGAGASGGGPGRLDPEQVRREVAQTLPAHLVPQQCVIVESIPLSSNGKVDTRALPRVWPQPDSSVVAPRAGLEQRIHRLWSETLLRDDFGVHENFFELGGDSLHAVRISTLLREDLGLPLSADDGLRLLFDHPTVAGQAAALGEPDAG